jgi:hypothetical protein
VGAGPGSGAADSVIYYPQYPLCGDLELVDVAVDDGHTCGLDRFQTAWCWGSNAAGQTGGGAAYPEPKYYCPVPVAGNRSYTAITVGTSFSCALDGDKRLWCW